MTASDLTGPGQAQCPQCRGLLKIWPEAASQTFSCQHPGHLGQQRTGRGRKMRNRGNNQLHCFPCDYSVCVNCAHQSDKVTLTHSIIWNTWIDKSIERALIMGLSEESKCPLA